MVKPAWYSSIFQIPMKWFYIALFVLIGWVACKPKGEPVHSLGVISFEVTASKEAESLFEKGLLLLHSFEFDDAEKAFKEARLADPYCLMAYWGEAMTHNHPLWRYQDKDKATEIINKGNEILKKQTVSVYSELEMDFWRSLHVLYDENGTKNERDLAYSVAMEEMYQKYPANHEVAAFYAISLLGSVAEGRDDATYERSAAITKSILRENPSHPGALHYLIHAYDDPDHAFLAINAADSYAKVAPDAAHALHMPSHIYVALGMWDENIQSNIDSYEASVRRMERENLDNDARSYHALHFLMYGYLQKGKLFEAHDIVQNVVKYTQQFPSPRARGYLVSMTGNLWVESGSVIPEYSGMEIELSDLNVVAKATHAFVFASLAAKDKNVNQVNAISDTLYRQIQAARLIVTNEATPMCSAIPMRNVPNRLDIGQAEVVLLQIQSIQAELAGNFSLQDKLLAEASAKEMNLSYEYGPPTIVQPSFEMYGKFLLNQGRYEDAFTQYQKALHRGPGRMHALKGISMALDGLGKREKSEEYKKLLQANLKEADLEFHKML
ncbi:MAG TPA: hypothetical protein PKC30_14310 [Saprospiraceae bacterium]|nr:hypothetical protein [Saprospiraceae bacterium]